MQLFWPSVESLTSFSLESNTFRNVQVTEEADQEKEDEEVTYERLRGCENVEYCEEISKETKSSLPKIPEVQFECNHKTCTKTYSGGNVLKEQTLAPDEIRPHWEVTSPQPTSQILTTHHLPLKKQIPKHKKGNSILLGYKTEDGYIQEKDEKEDSDNVNFFSLILGGQHLEQRDEAEEQMDDVIKVKPEVPLFVLEPSKPAMDLQPTMSSESTDKHISYSDEEEDEDTEEEEAFSGYMMRS